MGALIWPGCSCSVSVMLPMLVPHCLPFELEQLALPMYASSRYMCSSTCLVYRNVKAKKDAQGGADVSADGSECEGQDKPPTEAPCKPCTSFCDNQDCSGHGTCSGEVCMCADGWGGPYCGIDTSECASGKLDVNEECCPSGVLDDDGICCSAPEGVTPERDWNGQCCPGTVDACGRCNGDTACIGLDVEGTCCEVRTATLCFDLLA